MIPLLNLGWSPGMCTMAWQQINYFAVADVELWGVKISLPRWFLGKVPKQSFYFFTACISLFMNMAESLHSNWSQNHREYLAKFPNSFFNSKDTKTQPVSITVHNNILKCVQNSLNLFISPWSFFLHFLIVIILMITFEDLQSHNWNFYGVR